jgi:hypothetical protein
MKKWSPLRRAPWNSFWAGLGRRSGSSNFGLFLSFSYSDAHQARIIFATHQTRMAFSSHQIDRMAAAFV